MPRIALLEAASEVQQQQYLPAIAAGEQIWTLAFTEPSARFDADGVDLTARPEDGDSTVLNGTKLFIRDSHVADQMVVVRAAVEGERIALFVVDARAPGVRHTPIRSIASDKQCAIKLRQCPRAERRAPGAAGTAWPASQRIA